MSSCNLSFDHLWNHATLLPQRLRQSTRQYDDLAIKIGEVVKPIFEACFIAFLFYLNPFIFPIATFIGMARIPPLDPLIDKIAAIWERYWPVIALVLTPAMVIASAAAPNIVITAVVTGSAITAALYCGRYLARWVEEQEQAQISRG